MMEASALIFAFAFHSVVAFSPITHRLLPPRSLPTAPFAGLCASTSTTPGSDVSTLPRISEKDVNLLMTEGFVVIPKFLNNELLAELRNDVTELRTKEKFKNAGIGEGKTNALNQDIRIAETCFLGENKLNDVPNGARQELYGIIDNICQDLPYTLDRRLTELQYGFTPKNGFYRRHMDSIPGSSSNLREVSLLLYLQDQWDESMGGKLRLHRDSGGDFLPEGEAPNYVDVEPRGGTLVLFKSDKIPHEVLDTNADRAAVVGWFNRFVTASDISELVDVSPVRVIGLAVAAALVTIGLVNILG